MKTSGKCPKCNSNEIYCDAELPKRGDRASIAISSWSKLFIDVYVCISCGYVEEYVENNDLNDSKKMEKLKSNWGKPK